MGLEETGDRQVESPGGADQLALVAIDRQVGAGSVTGVDLELVQVQHLAGLRARTDAADQVDVDGDVVCAGGDTADADQRHLGGLGLQ